MEETTGRRWRLRMTTHTLIFYLLFAMSALSSANSDARSPATVSLGEVDVTVGGSVSLPCDMTLPTPDDAIYLVVWFLEPGKKPIYTFDARGKPLSMGRRWSEVASFGLRADFRFTLHGQVPSKGHLVINGTTLNDEGLYRCRVDFKNSPARHYRVQLNVTVPPSEPEIMDEAGRRIRSDRIGPLKENQGVVLHCHVNGGKPPPRIEWYLNGQRLPSLKLSAHQIRSVLRSAGVSSSLDTDATLPHVEELRLGPVGRAHQDAIVTCRASNSPSNPVKFKSVTIDVQLPPLKAEILRPDSRVAIGESPEFRCQTYGSRPAATVTWWIDNLQLPDSLYRVFSEEDDNVTVSVVKTILNKTDHGKILTCRASNRFVEASAVEDFIRLDVQFAPIATLRLGSTLNPGQIKEGDDVYFECSIEANPNVTRLIWKHEERTLVYNATGGVIMSNQSLVLRGVNRHRSGNYKCIGINARGEGFSNWTPLTVRYGPICQTPVKNIRGAERGELATLTCSADGFPRPLKYRWAVNTTRGWKDLVGPSSTSSNETLQIRPDLESDFGAVACWAMNDVGWQTEPCVFRFFPAGPPESLSNCSILNQTADSIHVYCCSNDDGGLKQTFQLQAMDAMTGLPQLTLQSESVAEFWLDDLEPGSTFMLYIYAVNTKGLSSPFVLPVSTLKEAAKRTVPPTTYTFPSNVVGAITIGTGAGVLILTTISVVACIRCKRQSSLANRPADSTNAHRCNDADGKAKGTYGLNGRSVAAGSVGGDEAAEMAGFYHRPLGQPLPTASARMSCFKLPPDFVLKMTDSPESCV